MSAFASSTKAAPEDQELAVCNSCCAVFSTPEKLRQHYKGEWHILNSKRRGIGLQACTKEEFKRARGKSKSGQGGDGGSVISISTSCLPNGGGSRVAIGSRQGAVPISSARGNLGLRPGVSNRPTRSTPMGPITGVKKEHIITVEEADEEHIVSLASKMGIDSERATLIAKMALEAELQDPLAGAEKNYLMKRGMVSTGAEGTDSSLIVESDGSVVGIKADKSVDIDMEKVAISGADVGEVDEEEEGGDDEEEEEEIDRSLYLPTDPNISIFDNKVFASSQENADYMLETFGFFIPDQEYLTDLDGFFSYLNEKVKIGGVCLYCQKQCKPGIPCQQHMLAKGHCKIAFEEGIDEDEFEDFYDYSIGEDEDEDDDIGLLGIMPSGELRLQDGRIVGHRAFAKYYKQHFAPMDTRPAILAQRREDLIRMEARIGALKMDALEIAALSDRQVAELMVKERRAERKALVVAQRQERRYMFREQRREYKSTVDKLRSQETRNQVIHDYHGMLQ